jgi:hypothetical protein
MLGDLQFRVSVLVVKFQNPELDRGYKLCQVSDIQIRRVLTFVRMT